MSIRRLTTFSVFLCAFSLGLTGCQIHLAIAPPKAPAENLASRLQTTEMATKHGIGTDERRVPLASPVLSRFTGRTNVGTGRASGTPPSADESPVQQNARQRQTAIQPVTTWKPTQLETVDATADGESASQAHGSRPVGLPQFLQTPYRCIRRTGTFLR